MIPRVKTWRCTVTYDNGNVEIIHVTAPTRTLAKLNLRFDYPRTMGQTVRFYCERGQR